MQYFIFVKSIKKRGGFSLTEEFVFCTYEIRVQFPKTPSLFRLKVRTSSFQDENVGSIPIKGKNFFFLRFIIIVKKWF